MRLDTEALLRSRQFAFVVHALLVLGGCLVGVLIGVWAVASPPPAAPFDREQEFEARRERGVRLPSERERELEAQLALAVTECASLRERLAQQRSKPSTAAGSLVHAETAEVCVGPEKARVTPEDIEVREEHLLDNWEAILGRAARGVEQEQRRRFASFYAEILGDRQDPDVRPIFEVFCVGYEGYRLARIDYERQIREVRNATEQRRLHKMLLAAERRMWETVLPVLTDTERSAMGFKDGN